MRLDKLDLNLLVVLDALLDELHVTKAAARLNLSQPATSNALQRLRQHFEDALIVSAGRQLLKTPFALEIEPDVKRLVAQSRSLANRRSHFDPGMAQRRFLICASDYTAMVLMVDVVRRLATTAPGIALHLHPAGEGMLERFESGGVDLLLAPPPFLTEDHPHVPLLQDDYCCVAWNGNTHIPDAPTLQDYVSAEHVAIHGFPTVVEDAMLARLGLTRHIAVTSPSYLLMPDFVTGTQRIATLHRRLALRLASHADLKLLQPQFELPTLDLHLQWHQHQETDLGSLWLRTLLLEAAAALMAGR